MDMVESEELKELKELAKHIVTLKKLAEEGDATMQLCLATLYENGLVEGVGIDGEEIMKWYRMAAENGDARAQLMMGCNYANGTYVKQDIKEAKKWSLMAAEQDMAEAQYALAMLYIVGVDEPSNEDIKTATYWLMKAAQLGYQEAINYLNKVNNILRK